MSKNGSQVTENDRPRALTEVKSLKRELEVCREHLRELVSHGDGNQLEILKAKRTILQIKDKIARIEDEALGGSAFDVGRGEASGTDFIDKNKNNSDNGIVNLKSEEISRKSNIGSFSNASRAESSRWAEGNRPGVRFPMRLSNNLIDEIDAAAQAEGKTRTEWFVSTIENFLSQNAGQIPPDSPEYKSTRAIHIRLDEELNDRIVAASERSSLKKTEWARRVMRSQLSSRSTDLDFRQEP